MKDHNEKSPYPNPQTLGKKKINKTQQIQTQEGKKIPRKKKTIPNGSGFSEAEEIGGSEKNA